MIVSGMSDRLPVSKTKLTMITINMVTMKLKITIMMINKKTKRQNLTTQEYKQKLNMGC